LEELEELKSVPVVDIEFSILKELKIEGNVKQKSTLINSILTVSVLLEKANKN